MARGLRIGYPRAFRVSADGSTYTHSGQSASLNRGRSLAAAQGNYTLTGRDANLVFSSDEPTWSETVPTVSFTQGVASTYDLVQHTDFFNPANHKFEIATGALPSGVTLDEEAGYVYDGAGAAASTSGVSINIADIDSEIDPAADWASRSSGAFFAENFNYANLSAASSHATNPKFYGSSTGNPPSSSIMSINSGGLSAKYLRINFPANSGGSGYSWLYTFDDNNGIQVPFTGVAHDNFYFQCILRMDGHIDFPFKTSGDEMASPKMFIIDKHNSSSNPGEVVCTNDHMRGFIQFYAGFTPSHGSQLLSRSINTPQGTPDFRAQNAVDAGAPSSPSTMAQFRARYGPFTSDTPNFPFASVTGSSSLAAAGFPNATSSQAGVPWVRNVWMVVTVHVHGAANTVRVWASEYGEAPVMICDTGQINFGGALDMGRGSTGYPGFQLTPFITGNTNAAGASQPETWIDYAEIIAKNSPINHPGGFALPGA